jgi:hypothetical protein
MNGKRRTRAGRLNRLHTGLRVYYLIGPLKNMPDPQVIKAGLQGVAAGGSSQRAGLLPTRRGRRWVHDPTCDAISVTTSDLPVGTDPARAIDLFASGTREDTPLRIQTSGDWLFVDFDHGLGDVNFMAEILAVIASGSSGYLPPEPLVNCEHPERAALIHALRNAPLAEVKSAKSTLHRRDGGPKVEGRLSEPASTAYMRTATDFLDRVRDMRDRHYPGVSMTSLFTLALARSFGRHGIEIDNRVDVLVNLRRYLPSDKGTLSNFVGVLTVPIDQSDDPRAVAAALNLHKAGYGPLTRQLASTLLSYRRPISPEFSRWRTRSRARLILTDLSARDAMNKIEYQPNSTRICISKMPQRYSHQICISYVRSESELHMSASFYRSCHDAQKVQLALEFFADELMAPLRLQQ